MTKNTDKIGVCPLSCQPGHPPPPHQLCESHVFSEFLYEMAEMYRPAEGVQRAKYSVLKQDSLGLAWTGRHGIGQRGLLLCEHCEQIRGKVETHLKKYLEEIRDLIARDRDTILYDGGADSRLAKSIKLFWLWTFLVASLSKLPSFANFKLPDEAESRLKSMLYRSDEGSAYEDACILFAPISLLEPTDPLDPESETLSVLVGLVQSLWRYGTVATTWPESFGNDRFLKRVLSADHFVMTAAGFGCIYAPGPIPTAWRELRGTTSGFFTIFVGCEDRLLIWPLDVGRELLDMLNEHGGTPVQHIEKRGRGAKGH